MKPIDYGLTSALLIFCCGILYGQDPAKVKADCEQRLQDIKNKVTDLNDKYNQTLVDLRGGHFCSDCRRSRTELQASGINFSAHIQEGAARGRHVVAATQEDFSKAYQRYKSEYDRQNNEFERVKASCKSRYDLAVEASNQRIEEERKREAEERENAAREKQEQQEQERQRIVEENQRIAEQQEMARQQALRDLQAQIEQQRQETLASIASSTQQITDEAQQRGEQMRNSIMNMNTGGNNDIAFDQKEHMDGQSISSGDIGSLDDFEVSKYEQMKEDFDRWHEASVRYLRERHATYEDQQTYESFSNGIGDDETAYKSYRLFDMARTAYDRVANRVNNLRDGVRDFVLEAEGVESNTIEGWSNYAGDRALDYAIETSTSGQRKRQLHYVNGVLHHVVDGGVRDISSKFDQISDESAENYDYDPRTAFFGNAHHLVGGGSTFKDLYDFAETVKSAPTMKQKIRAMGIFVYRKWND